MVGSWHCQKMLDSSESDQHTSLLRYQIKLCLKDFVVKTPGVNSISSLHQYCVILWVFVITKGALLLPDTSSKSNISDEGSRGG